MPDIASISDFDLRVFIRRNAEEYLEYLNRQRRVANGTAAGWVWMGFLFAPVWLCYRKLYGAFFLWLSYAIVVQIAAVLIPDLVPVAPALMALFAGVVALQGKYWVLRRATRVASQADKMGLERDARENYLRSKGGVSIPTMLLSCVLLVWPGAYSVFLIIRHIAVAQ